MVSVGSIVASSLCGFALWTLSAAEDAKDGWKRVDVNNITEADSALLYKTWGNVSTYAPGVTTYGCGRYIGALEIKSAAAAGSKAGTRYDFKLQSSTDYHFSVEGCSLEPGQTQLLGECGDMEECIFTDYEVYITSEPQTNTLKLTAVTAKEVDAFSNW